MYTNLNVKIVQPWRLFPWFNLLASVIAEFLTRSSYLCKKNDWTTCFYWHSLKSGSETRDSETQDSGLWDQGTCDPATRGPDTPDPGTWTLGHGTLTARTLDLGPWNLGLAIRRSRILRGGLWELNLWHRLLVSRLALQIELTLIV